MQTVFCDFLSLVRLLECSVTSRADKSLALIKRTGLGGDSSREAQAPACTRYVFTGVATTGGIQVLR